MPYCYWVLLVLGFACFGFCFFRVSFVIVFLRTHSFCWVFFCYGYPFEGSMCFVYSCSGFSLFVISPVWWSSIGFAFCGSVFMGCISLLGCMGRGVLFTSLGLGG